MTDEGPVTDEVLAADRADPIVVLNRDLMFGVQIGNVVRALGFDPRFARTTDAFVEAIRRRDPRPALGIVDMNGPIDWDTIAKLTSEPDGPPLVGFGPHVDVEGRRAAKAAGMTRIVSNGEFHRGMAELIGRYARSADGGGPDPQLERGR
jgi:hypothetical protein